MFHHSSKGNPKRFFAIFGACTPSFQTKKQFGEAIVGLKSKSSYVYLI